MGHDLATGFCLYGNHRQGQAVGRVANLSQHRALILPEPRVALMRGHRPLARGLAGASAEGQEQGR
mgnify:CR=1 FL=1